MSIRESIRERTDMARMQAEGQAVSEFYRAIMREDEVSYEEAVRLCSEDPKYSLGMKIQLYMVDAALAPTHAKRYRDEMLATLTPEERTIYDDEVADLNLTRMVREAVRSKRRAWNE